MDTKSRRLGKGLSGLIGQPVSVSSGAVGEDSRALVRIPTGLLVPNPFQPRLEFDEGELNALAGSIARQGLMQPVVVRRLADGRGYELIAGERRWRASQRAGLAEVPAIVVEIDDQQAAAWAMVENVQRVELGAMEKARGYRRLHEQFNMTHSEISQAVGEERSIVSNYIRLTELETPIQELMTERKLHFGHGKVLLGIPPGATRIMIARRCAEEQASIRGLERMIEEHRARAMAVSGEMPVEAKVPDAGSGGEPGPARPGLLARAQIMDLERQISDQLGTRVKINAKGTGAAGAGTIHIAFYTHEQFEGLLERMNVRITHG